MYIYYMHLINICVYYIYIYTDGLPVKSILFLTLKVLFLMKQVKHPYAFNHNTKYKSSSVSLTLL